MDKVEGLQELTGDFDSLLYYDKKALEERMYQYLANKHLIKKFLNDKMPLDKIMEYTELTEKEVNEIIKEIKEESEIPKND